MHIRLTHNNAFRWYTKDNLYVKGYIFYNSQYICGENFLSFVYDLISSNTFVMQVSSFNGCFSIIYKESDKVSLVSDPIRFFPLFYHFSGKHKIISDNPDEITKCIEKTRIQSIAREEFYALGYVTGKKTLLEEVCQLQAGEYLCVDNNGKFISQKQLASYAHKILLKDDLTKLKIQALERIENAFHNLALSLKNKTPVLPLSGGFDSRLIAVMLKKSGFENTICFTFGRTSNYEVEISEKVASQLNFKWHFIEYTPEIIKDFFNDPFFNNYYKYASQYTSMFYMQEYFAVKHLKEQSLIPDNAVFIPGHSGDILGGSQYGKVIPFRLKHKNLVKTIYKRKYTLKSSFLRFKKEILNEINTQIEEKYPDKHLFSASSLFEDWDIREKFTKFICNSAHIFDYFGYEVRFPFWDVQLAKFFTSISLEFRRNKRLYDEILIEKYFKPFDVYFSKDSQPTVFDYTLQKVKYIVKQFLPKTLRIKFLIKNDWPCYYEISKELYAKSGIDFPKQFLTRPFNLLLIHWYIKRLERKNYRDM